MPSLWFLAFVSLVLSSINIQGGSAQHCGIQAGGALCQEGFCCSNWGWCGTTDPYCAPGQCQSQCPTPSPPPPPTPAPGGIADLISSEMFDELLPFRNDDRCYAVGFYTYEAFIQAAASFPEFGRTGDNATRKREIAAFLAHTSHVTYVPQGPDWWNPPRGRYYWGYCRVESAHQPATDFYCDRNKPTWPCAPGKQYFGRGPFQLRWNYNYGQCGDALGLDLLNNPDLVSSDPVISFKTAFWFWMTPQDSMPSCHDVMIGAWTPSSSDVAAGRLSGFGVTTNIIHGQHECRGGPNPAVQEMRIGFYQRYCGELNIETGDNLDCYNQRPFGVGLRNSLYPHIEEVVSEI